MPRAGHSMRSLSLKPWETSIRVEGNNVTNAKCVAWISGLGLSQRYCEGKLGLQGKGNLRR